MKIIQILSLWAVGTSNVIHGLMGSSAQSAVLTAAEKFLKGKKSQTPVSSHSSVIHSPPVPATKPASKMSKLIDLGTNAAMAIAGAGTLYSALSDSVGKPPVQVRTFIVIFNHFYLFILTVFS